MARPKRPRSADTVPGEEATPATSYRYADKRKNNPPAGLAAQGRVEERPKVVYSYDPHLPPVLRFDATGKADDVLDLAALIEKAKREPLTTQEAERLAAALRIHQPWLEWTGKLEQRSFAVDPVALHIHERVAAEAIIAVAKREDVQRSLFADPDFEYREAVKFYQHDMDWANRLILGDSLTVMNSLAVRENLAGKVQMIYIDPPYGIKYASNFQPFIDRREVKDREQDLTREPEQVKAYRDTWTLGIHSYLTYLRARLLAAKVMLADTGSVFLQIGDENLHRVRNLLDEVFGPENAIVVIQVQKTGSQSGDFLQGTSDYLLWYVKDKEHARAKFRPLFTAREGTSDDESPDPLTSEGAASEPQVFQAFGRSWSPGDKAHWKTTFPEGMTRLLKAERIIPQKNQIRFRKAHTDFPVKYLGANWNDTGGARDMLYVVQTARKVVERCLLMTTDPGDLVLDPTCGSGTTAYVAEQWGRRWIAIDTSRVAVALARQRLLTAKFDYYAKQDPGAPLHPERNTFRYKTVPHITLKSIAQNPALDPVFARWEPVMVEKLAALNAALPGVSPAVRAALQAKLATKEKQAGKSSITEVDRRRWLLPREQWQEWEVPFDADPDWPVPLRAALEDYRRVWRAKLDEVDATIAASAPSETLVDQPEVERSVVRVSGPFTVEGLQPGEETLELESPIDGAPEALDTFGPDSAVEAANADAYLSNLIRLLAQDGVRFPNNQQAHFDRLEAVPNSVLHAAGEWTLGGRQRRVAVAVGPQYGPITAKQVEDCLWAASRSGYDDLVFAGFTFDAAAQAAIQDDSNPRVRCHMAFIRPDVNMGGLLKDTAQSQLFTVFGLPRVNARQQGDGEWTVEMEGVDIYDPASNSVVATRAEKVAAWFLDGDYDGRTFCITQAFFPERDAWDKLAKALKTLVDPDRFAAFSGTKSLPFRAGPHQRAAVKVIDPRGNEVMCLIPLK